MIVFNNFTRQYESIKNEIDNAVQNVLNKGWFILGDEGCQFENEFANYIGVSYCVGVASGTDAITLSLMALDIGNGDEVITSNMTAYPTITGIMRAGAIPVVVDISVKDGLIDWQKIEKKINHKTKAIIPVHLYGQSCNMDPILQLADQNHLSIIEDCAQAAGATYKNKYVGSNGTCSAFSFYPTKNLGAYGDGGAITTNDENIYNKLLLLRNYGKKTGYEHTLNGVNSRLDELQAAILRVKLKYLKQWNEKRRQIAYFYQQYLNTVECLVEHSYGQCVYHLFVVRTHKRDDLLMHLKRAKIQSLIHYPIPINKQKAYPYQQNECFENTELFADTILSLPIFPELNTDELKTIVKVINEFN
ncbi:MAG: DegT/DnrJ/EryC1/StrS family aminotransferase [Spirochaetota bacterium]|nr:DegT/DnrJ/EryC1/StrS family aminotransferase [Spirochaetota bacterium]